MTSPLSPETVLRAVGSQVWCDLGDEVAILHLGSGFYYGFDGVGARVWALLQEPRSVSDLGDVIICEYEVDRPRFEKDLPAFLSALEQADLIEVDHAPGQPFYAPNLFIHWSLYAAARARGVRVFLDGLDGDTTLWQTPAYLADLLRHGRAPRAPQHPAMWRRHLPRLAYDRPLRRPAWR